MWGNPTLFHRANSTEKNIEKINIDAINWEKLFHQTKSTEANIDKR